MWSRCLAFFCAEVENEKENWWNENGRSSLPQGQRDGSMQLPAKQPMVCDAFKTVRAFHELPSLDDNAVVMLEGSRAASARKVTTRKARRSEAFVAWNVALPFSELSHVYSSR